MVFSKRNIAAFFLAHILIISGKLKNIKKRSSERKIILSVYFHDPSRDLFESCVKWFLRKGYSFISTDELLLIAGNKKPFPASAVIFTVDDGWKNNKENIAAVAARYKIPVTIFASTQPIASGEAYWWSYIAEAGKRGLTSQSVGDLKKVSNEERLQAVASVKAKIPLQREALTIEEVRNISGAGYVTIGSHTVNHPILTSCVDHQSAYEIGESKKILESWLDKDVQHFAYPNGMFTDREINFLNQYGYKSAYTTNPQYITADNFTNLFTLPRFDVLEDISFTENICRMTGAWFDKPALISKS